ncbi:helix-turn-helix domain-containing protein [Roseovarius sp. EL26]|uniref:helix-turn-helix domain-containing protein n=1 Tax=Roseovarius sp. EL26 TaxID=2126672 RepID=UPI000EA00A10|nr:helix-turn-helix domain-containing protein [Roseovarius sp. EL26]
MTATSGKSDYNKLRFDWKKEVNASANLSRGAKHMAAYLCDTFVNKENGCCWPKNKTLARKLSLSTRTVQRHIKELLERGWLRHAKIKNTRRALQIAFPSKNKGDTEHGILSPTRMTKMSRRDDTTVTPYKNQENNLRICNTSSLTISTVTIGEQEELALATWETWVKDNTTLDIEDVFGLLRRNGGFVFPVRFPKDEDACQYKMFFQDLVASNGANIARR